MKDDTVELPGNGIIAGLCGEQIGMYDIVFDRDCPHITPQSVPCCVCRKPVLLRGNSFRTHWAIHAECADRIERGLVNEVTFYDGRPKGNRRERRAARK